MHIDYATCLSNDYLLIAVGIHPREESRSGLDCMHNDVSRVAPVTPSGILASWHSESSRWDRFWSACTKRYTLMTQMSLLIGAVAGIKFGR
jgi:hypothetical protein